MGYKSHAQRKAVHASKAEKKGASMKDKKPSLSKAKKAVKKGMTPDEASNKGLVKNKDYNKLLKSRAYKKQRADEAGYKSVRKAKKAAKANDGFLPGASMKKFPEIKEKNEGKFTKWVEKNMPGTDTCKAASKIMRSKTKKYSSSVVKMANYANNFGCKTKKEGASMDHGKKGASFNPKLKKAVADGKIKGKFADAVMKG